MGLAQAPRASVSVSATVVQPTGLSLHVPWRRHDPEAPLRHLRRSAMRWCVVAVVVPSRAVRLRLEGSDPTT